MADLIHPHVEHQDVIEAAVPHPSRVVPAAFQFKVYFLTFIGITTGVPSQAMESRSDRCMQEEIWDLGLKIPGDHE